MLIGIVLLGRAHEIIDEHRQNVALRDTASHQSDMKPVSKDDLDLLTPTLADTSPLRRSHSLCVVSYASSVMFISVVLYFFALCRSNIIPIKLSVQISDVVELERRTKNE